MIFRNCILVMLLCLCNNSKAQYRTDKDIESFTYLSIKNTLSEYPTDSIRFIVTGDITKEKPLILFCSGSGNGSIMKYDSTGTFLGALPEFIPKVYSEKYHIVVISKPGIPFTTHINVSPFDRNAPEVFWKCDTKDFHTKSTALVLEYLHQQKYIETSKIYLAGHSQGAEIAAKVAATYPHLISKVVYMSSNILGRSTQNLVSLYTKVVKGDITQQQFIDESDKIYNEQKYWKNYVDNYEPTTTSFDIDYYITQNNNSYNIDITANYLPLLKVPILFVYGTVDIKSIDCSLIPLILLNTKVDYTIKPFPNMEHNYFGLDKNGQINYDDYNWPVVFSEVIKWLEE